MALLPRNTSILKKDENLQSISKYEGEKVERVLDSSLCDLAGSASAGGGREVGLCFKTFHQSCSWTLAEPHRDQDDKDNIDGKLIHRFRVEEMIS